MKPEPATDVCRVWAGESRWGRTSRPGTARPWTAQGSRSLTPCDCPGWWAGPARLPGCSSSPRHTDLGGESLSFYNILFFYLSKEKICTEMFLKGCDIDNYF